MSRYRSPRTLATRSSILHLFTNPPHLSIVDLEDSILPESPDIVLFALRRYLIRRWSCSFKLGLRTSLGAREYCRSRSRCLRMPVNPVGSIPEGTECLNPLELLPLSLSEDLGQISQDPPIPVMWVTTIDSL